jgi:hypothetical protein
MRAELRIGTDTISMVATKGTPWLLMEWPEEEKVPTIFWLTNLPEGTSLISLVRLAKIKMD